MQSENFDKKIKSSLSQRPPGNDKPAWDKMERLLDKHLPQRERDRRIVVIALFLFLLTGGGAFLILKNNNRDTNDISSTNSQTKKSEQVTNNNVPGETRATSPLPATGDLDDQPVQLTQQPGRANKNLAMQNIPSEKSSINIITRQEPNDDIAVADKNNNIKVNDKPINSDDATRKVTDPGPVKANEELKQQDLQNDPLASKDPAQPKEIDGSQPISAQKTAAKKQNNGKSFLSNLFFTASAGPDLSTVDGNAGEVQLNWGGGIGYQISKRFSIRAGFYAARKVYTADPEDYHPPYNLWQYFPNLKKIDADCKVYEIPVTVDFAVSKKQKSSWFVSAGVSTLLMKEETYEYYYKPNSSPTYVTYTRTMKDENKHFFSILNLSGGYTRVLNKHVSLQAEPYVKFAMNGVGYGKVDLNSGGILFSAIVKPFASKK